VVRLRFEGLAKYIDSPSVVVLQLEDASKIEAQAHVDGVKGRGLLERRTRSSQVGATKRLITPG